MPVCKLGGARALFYNRFYMGVVHNFFGFIKNSPRLSSACSLEIYSRADPTKVNTPDKKNQLTVHASDLTSDKFWLFLAILENSAGSHNSRQRKNCQI